MRQSAALQKHNEIKSRDKQYRSHVQDNDVMLVNPLQNMNPMMEFLTVAYKYFPKADTVLHTLLMEQPDFIINDNSIALAFLNMDFHL